jgi:hypothetical protein
MGPFDYAQGDVISLIILNQYYINYTVMLR